MTVASNYHIEVNASDAGMYDRIVVMELIKTVAQTHQLDSAKQRHFKGEIICTPTLSFCVKKHYYFIF